MAKRRLTQNQQRRISSNHHRKINQSTEWQDEMLGEAQTGLVITRHAKHADVENEQDRKSVV